MKSNNKSIQVFSFDDQKDVRVVMKDGEPWWVAKDVCDILSIKNATQAVEPLDADERSMFCIGRQGEVNIINESGLYALILRSNKKEAKRFRKWVTSEVLPSIRKTGAYSVNEVTVHHLDPEEIALRYKEVEAKMQELSLTRVAMLNSMVQDFKDRLSPVAVDALVAYATNAMVGYEVMSMPKTERLYSATEIGKMLGISRNMVGRMANTLDLKQDQYGQWVLDKAENCDKQVSVFRYNQAGVDVLREAYDQLAEQDD